MSKLRYLTILLITTFIGGCSTQKNYFVEMNPEDRDKISVIHLSIDHNKIPEEHCLVMNVVTDQSGTRAWPVGVPRSWSPEMHEKTLTNNVLCAICSFREN